MRVRVLAMAIVCLAAGRLSWGTGFPGFDILRGDANNDGQVNISDSIAITYWLFTGGSAPPCLDAADANDDGHVNLADTSYLNVFLFLGGPAPPPPYPACGEDSTEDLLSCDQSACP